MSIGENIKKYRIISKMSQQKLAEKCNVSQSAVGSWETNKRRLTYNNLYMLSKALKTDISEIIGDDAYYLNMLKENRHSKSFPESLEEAFHVSTIIDKDNSYFFENDNIQEAYISLIQDVNIGSILSNIREQLSFSTAFVSERTGLTEKYIIELENNMKKPSLAELKTLCEVLDIQIYFNYVSKSPSSLNVSDDRIQALKPFSESRLVSLNINIHSDSSTRHISMNNDGFNQELKLMSYFNNLNREGKKRAVELLESLTYTPRYKNTYIPEKQNDK